MKKILFGFYILIIIGIIVCISNSNIFDSKKSEAIAAGEKIYKKIVFFVTVRQEKEKVRKQGRH
jgi:cytochrome c oxidase cbb3-type subunit 3